MLKLTGDLEQEIMNILWVDSEPLIPSVIQSRLSKKLAYTTVKTILERLHDKGLLNRQKKSGVYYYSPKVSKESYGSKSLRSVFKNILGSYGNLAISQFIESIKEEPESLDLLKKYLEDEENKSI